MNGPTDIFVFVHGNNSEPCDWHRLINNMRELLDAQRQGAGGFETYGGVPFVDKGRIAVFASSVNKGKGTRIGIRVCAKKLLGEIDILFRRIQSWLSTSTSPEEAREWRPRLHLVGHSLGGLFIRCALGMLQERTDKKIGERKNKTFSQKEESEEELDLNCFNIEESTFTSICTPHLGIAMAGSFGAAWNTGAVTLNGLTGRELVFRDGAGVECDDEKKTSEKLEKNVPLLIEMALPDSIYMRSFRKLRHRTLIGLVQGDVLVDGHSALCQRSVEGSVVTTIISIVDRLWQTFLSKEWSVVMYSGFSKSCEKIIRLCPGANEEQEDGEGREGGGLVKKEEGWKGKGNGEDRESVKGVDGNQPVLKDTTIGERGKNSATTPVDTDSDNLQTDSDTDIDENTSNDGGMQSVSNIPWIRHRIKRRSSLEISTEVESGMTLHYEFKVSKFLKIYFSIRLFLDDDKEKNKNSKGNSVSSETAEGCELEQGEIILLDETRSGDSKGTVKIPSKGKVVLCWNNENSKFSSRRIKRRLWVTKKELTPEKTESGSFFSRFGFGMEASESFGSIAENVFESIEKFAQLDEPRKSSKSEKSDLFIFDGKTYLFEMEESENCKVVFPKCVLDYLMNEENTGTMRRLSLLTGSAHGHDFPIGKKWWLNSHSRDWLVVLARLLLKQTERRCRRSSSDTLHPWNAKPPPPPPVTKRSSTV
eukprot:g4778.t1